MSLNLKIRRYKRGDNFTKGEFLVNDKKFGHILEDKVREDGVYIYGETAIPAGKYRVILSFSNRFKKRMPQLINMRGGDIKFGDKSIDQAGVRIHGGNTIDHTLGCPLLGEGETEEGVHTCKAINDKLIALIDEADNTSEVYLEIINNFDTVS